MTHEPRYPQATTKYLLGSENAFEILAIVMQELSEQGVNDVERIEFFVDATSGDYDHLLTTVSKWVTQGEKWLNY